LEESSSWKFATIFEIGSEQAGKNFFRNFDFISLFNSNSKKKFDHYITDTTNFGNRDSTNIPIEIDRKTMETSNNKKFRSNVKPECEIKIFGICIEHFIITYEISKCYNTRVRYFSQEAFIQFRFISDALEYIKSGYIVIQNVAYECRIIDLRRNLESDSFGNQSEANSSNKLNNSPQKSSFSSNSNSIIPPPGPSSNQNLEAQPSDAQNNSKNLSLTDYSSKYNVSDRMESNTKDALLKVRMIIWN